MSFDPSNSHNQKSYVECNPKNPLQPSPNMDPAPPYCGKEDEPNLNNVNDGTLNWLKENSIQQKTGYGAPVDCDPMQTGRIVNDLHNPDRNYIYRHSNSLRGCDEAILRMFQTLVVIDEDGKAWPIPCVPGPPEKAVSIVVSDNVRKDETLVVDRIRLPIMALTQTTTDYDYDRFTFHKAINHFRVDGKPSITMAEKRQRDTVFGVARGIPINRGYTVTAWTTHREDMNQIVEQILTKFSHAAYIRVTGVPWETIVKLDSIGNNTVTEPGDQDIRVIKYEFNLTVQSYIPQPMERKKAVLKMNIELVDGLTDNEAAEVMARLSEATKELEC